MRAPFLAAAESLEKTRAAAAAAAAVAAAASFLALVAVQAMRTSKATAAAVFAGAAVVATTGYFAKELENGLQISVTRAPEGEKGGVGLYSRDPESLSKGEPSEKALKRLQSIRNILLEEFMEEETRLADAEKAKSDEVARLEAIYETRVRTLQREITILKNKNVELSVFAGKAASYDALKLRAETEIASLKKTHDAEITALKAQIAGLEKTIETVEREMAEERAAMAAKLAASRFERHAAKRLHDSEMRKYRAALALSDEHKRWWQAESRRIDQEAAEKREVIEKQYSESAASSVAWERANAASKMEKALAELKRVSESKLEAAVAQALGERTALKTLMENELEKAERKRETDVQTAVRAAVAEAESRVAGDWRAKLEKIEAVNKNIAKTFNAEFERQRVAMASASAAEQDALRASHEATARAADAQHAKALEQAKLAAQNALAAAKRDALFKLERPPPPARRSARRLRGARRGAARHARAARARARRGGRCGAGRAPRGRAERGALYAHFRSEAAKTETVARARLAGELAEAEEKFAAFWKGKTERLQKAHDDKYAQLWADRTREVANLKKDLKASREAMLADERAAWAEERAAVAAGHERAAGRRARGRRRAPARCAV